MTTTRERLLNTGCAVLCLVLVVGWLGMLCLSLRNEARIAALEARSQMLIPTTFNGKPIRVPCFVVDARLPGVVYPLGYLMHCDPDRQIPEAP
jgi:hypothetical protein